MGTWWEYLAQLDFLPVSLRVWQRTIEHYGETIWPWSWVLWTALGLALALVAWRASALGLRVALMVLAAGWAVIGLVFFGRHVAPLTWAAGWAQGASLVQAMLLAAVALVGAARLDPSVSRRAAGTALVAAGLIGMPLGNLAAGWTISGVALAPTAADPTAIVTLGVALLVAGRAAWPLAVVPILWGALSVVLRFALR